MLAIILVMLSFRVDAGSILFFQLLATGSGAALISALLILYSTQIEKNIHLPGWRKKADAYYNDEGNFEYTYDGFTVLSRDGKGLAIPWKDIVRAESGENKINSHIRVFFIHLFLSETDFITVDSTMPGFTLFEKKLKENLRVLMSKEEIKDAQESNSVKQNVI